VVNMSNDINDLKKQVIKVIPILEEQYNKKPSAMLELILKRYRETQSILNNIDNLSKKDFPIIGGTRAYLESASDYDNPMLEEMYKAEKLVEKLLK